MNRISRRRSRASEKARQCAWLSLLFLTALSLDALAREGAGGGEYRLPEHSRSPLTEAQRTDIHARIEQNRAELRARGVLPSQQSRAVAPAPILAWPLQAVAGYQDYGYHGVSGFMDHDARSPGFLQDYMCGTRSYDNATGYDHAGVDFFLWPMSWNMMDEGTVQIVSAADGFILGKDDGEFDRSCGTDPAPWNGVYIEHVDGSVALYGHMKKDSVTTKSVGSTVARGEYLGLVGSSGISTGPHLHFELYDAEGDLTDPYSGPCNASPSWWASQRPYSDSAINKLATGSAPPSLAECDGPDEPMLKNIFDPGDTIYLTAYYRDQLQAQSSVYTIYQPDGSVFDTWVHSSAQLHYPASYWYWWDVIPVDAPLGRWRFEVIYEGDTYEHSFDVGLVQVPGLAPYALSGLMIALLVGGILRTRRAMPGSGSYGDRGTACLREGE